MTIDRYNALSHHRLACTATVAYADHFEQLVELAQWVDRKKVAWVRDQAVAEQQRIEAEQFAKQKSNEAAAKLAAEHAEAAKLLEFAFNSKGHVRR